MIRTDPEVESHIQKATFTAQQYNIVIIHAKWIDVFVDKENHVTPRLATISVKSKNYSLFIPIDLR